MASPRTNPSWIQGLALIVARLVGRQERLVPVPIPVTVHRPRPVRIPVDRL